MVACPFIFTIPASICNIDFVTSSNVQSAGSAILSRLAFEIQYRADEYVAARQRIKIFPGYGRKNLKNYEKKLKLKSFSVEC